VLLLYANQSGYHSPTTTHHSPVPPAPFVQPCTIAPPGCGFAVMTVDRVALARHVGLPPSSVVAPSDLSCFIPIAYLGICDSLSVCPQRSKKLSGPLEPGHRVELFTWI
jgi:hypothetical protein